jgi:hypothetical protein
MTNNTVPSFAPHSLLLYPLSVHGTEGVTDGFVGADCTVLSRSPKEHMRGGSTSLEARTCSTICSFRQDPMMGYIVHHTLSALHLLVCDVSRHWRLLLGYGSFYSCSLLFLVAS